jgi:hypothetical protein
MPLSLFIGISAGIDADDGDDSIFLKDSEDHPILSDPKPVKVLKLAR